MANIIKVERELFEKNGKSYFGYFIKGVVRGTEVKVQVSPHDFGGYTVLDIVFNGEMEAELKVTPFKMTAENGSVIEGNTFSVVSYDDNGEIYECPVKPSRRSDKTLMNMLLR